MHLLFPNPLLITSALKLGGPQIGGRPARRAPRAAGNSPAENEEQLRTEWRLSARAEEIEPIIIAIIRLIRRLSMSNRRTKESETNPLWGRSWGWEQTRCSQKGVEGRAGWRDERWKRGSLGVKSTSALSSPSSPPPWSHGPPRSGLRVAGWSSTKIRRRFIPGVISATWGLKRNWLVKSQLS